MSLSHQPSSPIRTTEPSPEIVAEVCVSTASAIVTSAHDPYRVLVARSAKHSRPVIPGGKIEKGDLESDSVMPGLRCVLREVLEEIGTALLEPRCIGKALDPDRDIRLVPASKLATAVVTPSLPEDVAPSAMVKAHYGCPDFIFVGKVDEAAIRSSEELDGLHFIDIRTLNPGDLSAGHDLILLAYRRMLEQGQTELPVEALRNFLLEREAFVAR